MPKRSQPRPRPLLRTLKDILQDLGDSLMEGGELHTRIDWLRPVVTILASASIADIDNAYDSLHFTFNDDVEAFLFRMQLSSGLMQGMAATLLSPLDGARARELPDLARALRVVTQNIVNWTRVSSSGLFEPRDAFQPGLYEHLEWSVKTIIALEDVQSPQEILSVYLDFFFLLMEEFAVLVPVFVYKGHGQMVPFPIASLADRFTEEISAASFDVSRSAPSVFMSLLLALLCRQDCSDMVKTLNDALHLDSLSSAQFLSILGTYLDCLLDPSSLPSISRIYRRIPHHLLSLLHATAMMALDPSMPYWFHASDDQSPAARRRFAASVGSLVASWLRRALADRHLAAQFFAINGRTASQSDLFYSSMCEGLAEYVLYDLLDGAEVAELIDAKLFFMPLQLPSDQSESLFWQSSTVLNASRLLLVINVALAEGKDCAAFIRRHKDVIIPMLVRLVEESVSEPLSTQKGFRAAFATRVAIKLAPHLTAAELLTLNASIHKGNMTIPVNDDFHFLLMALGSHRLRGTPADLLADPVTSDVCTAMQIGQLLQGVQHNPSWWGILRPDQCAPASPFSLLMRAEKTFLAVRDRSTLGEENGSRNVNNPATRPGVTLHFVLRLLRLVKRYPEAFHGPTVQSSLATFVLYFGRFLREAETEGLATLSARKTRLMQLSREVRDAGSDRVRAGARTAREEKERCVEEIARFENVLPAVHIARRRLHRLGQQLRAAVAVRLSSEA